MEKVNLIIYIAIAACGLIGALLGLRKGLYKALINLFSVLLSAGVSFALAKLLTKLVVNEKNILWAVDLANEKLFGNAEFMVNVRETLAALSERGNAVGMIAALPTVILTPLIFMIVYLVVRAIIKIPEALICRSIFGRHGGNRLGGVIVGAVTMIVSVGIFIMPLVGYVNLANTVLDGISPLESTEEQEEPAPVSSEEQNTQSLGATLSSISNSCAQINKDYVRHVCMTARDTKNVRAVSFNFHTPYPDTKELALSREEKARCCATIEEMMAEGAPVFNLKSAFPYLIDNRFPTPCHQCVVMENGKLSTCGRCIEVPGLCEQCGYFFVAEYTLLFGGNVKIIFDMLRTYLKYI